MIDEEREASMWDNLHRDAITSWECASRLFPILEKIASRPAFKELLTEAMRALDEGVPEIAVAAAVDVLHGSRERLAISRQRAADVKHAAEAKLQTDA
jgi:hypothetical protein